MKTTAAIIFLLVLAACESTTKGTGPGSSTSSSSGSSSSGSPSSSSSGSVSGSTSSGTPTISNAQCQSACYGKVVQCNPDHPDPQGACQELCSGTSYTTEQLDCFQRASCTELANATYFEDVCPP